MARWAPLLLLIVGLGLACGDGRRSRPPTPNRSADAGTNGNGSNPLRLTVRFYTLPYEAEGITAPAGQAFVFLEADVVNAGDADQPVSWMDFFVEAGGAAFPASSLTSRLPGRCEGAVNGHGRTLCPIYFVVQAGAALETLVLPTAAGDLRVDLSTVEGPPGLCPVAGPELDLAACSDGCNNDGDGYTDCEDADCCPVRSDCPPGTHCGGPEIECVPGVEDTLTEPFNTCRDACDNDGDTYVDCNDYDCCDLRVCGPDTSCGMRADPFVEPPFFDDARVVRAIDPSTLLAAPNPCRAPALVYVQYAPDGDTIDVTPLDGSGVEGLVRLLGVDSPEVGRNGDPSECYADEAADFTRQFVGRTVWLTFDAECLDRFDRHLAYVHFGSFRTDMLQRHLLRRGYAPRLVFQATNALGDLFDNDEQLARDAGAGLWSACP